MKEVQELKTALDNLKHDLKLTKFKISVMQEDVAWFQARIDKLAKDNGKK